MLNETLMPSWDQRILDSTRGQILRLIRGGTGTVNELAAELSLTDNAVRAHLISLERDGLVRQSGQRPGLRRPTYVYAISDAGEQLFPKAYGVVLSTLLDVLHERLEPRELKSAMRDVARRLAADQLPLVEGRPLKERLRHALTVLGSMGGLAELNEQDGKPAIVGRCCPFAQAVAGHPEVCLLAATFVSEIAGATVRERCHKTPGDIHCAFEIVP